MNAKEVARVGIDSAGGLILGGGQFTTKCNGSLVAVIGDVITPHGLGPHAAATMIEGSSTVKINGKGVCRKGDAASCGHTIGTGSLNTKVGD